MFSVQLRIRSAGLTAGSFCRVVPLAFLQTRGSESVPLFVTSGRFARLLPYLFIECEKENQIIISTEFKLGQLERLVSPVDWTVRV